MDNHKHLIIFLSALILRIVYVVLFPQLEVENDALVYDRMGLQIALGKGYPSEEIRIAPLYPFFLGGIYFLFGHNLLVVRLIQALIGSLTCLYTCLLGEEILNKRVGLISGWIAVFYPGFIFYTGLILTETLATFLLTFFIYRLSMIIKDEAQNWKYFLVSLLLGVLVLCRSEMLFLPAFIILCLLLQNRKKAIVQFLISLFAVIIVVAPWTIRNYMIFHRIIPVTTGFGRSLWLGSYPQEWTEWHHDEEPIKSLLKKKMQEIEYDDTLRRMAIENIKNHPFLYLKFSVKKFFRFWVTSHSNVLKYSVESFVSTIQNKKYDIFILKAFFLIINIGIICLGFLGVVFLRQQWRLLSIPLVVIGYKVLLHTMLFSAPRYQILIMAFVFGFSATAALRFWHYIRGLSLLNEKAS